MNNSAGPNEERQTMNDVCAYHVQLRGQIDEAEINAMSPQRMAMIQVKADATLFAINTDQSGVIGLIRHLHALGFVILSIVRDPA
jgi:hypothetical protein